MLAEIEAHHRVIDTVDDRAIVQQLAVGNLVQALERILVLGALRFFREIAGGQHDRAAEATHQQVMQGRVGQHETQLLLSGCDSIGQQPRCAHRQHHDGCGRRVQGLGLGIADLAVVAHFGDIRSHQGQRFVWAMLALAQLVQGLGIACIAGQVHAADALDGNDLPGFQARCGLGHRVGATDHRALRIAQPDMRAAQRAGVWLRMKAAVGGLAVLGGAVLAQLELLHAGVGAIVGNRAHDGKARAAVGAVGKGIQIAAVAAIKRVLQALGAGGGIGHHAGVHIGLLALDDMKADVSEVGVGIDLLDAVNARQRRTLRLQLAAEARQLIRAADQVDQYAAAIVADIAAQLQLVGNPPDGRAKAHALNKAAHPQALDNSGVSVCSAVVHQCTVQTIQGSNERTMCWMLTLSLPSSLTGVSTSACSSAPGVPLSSRGEKFQVVGATIW